MAKIVYPPDLDIFVQGSFTVSDPTKVPIIARSRLQQDDVQVYPIDLTSLRVWDAYQTALPGTSATDDLALIGAVFATGVPSIETYDVKAAGAVTLYARYQVTIPIEYEAGQTILMRYRAGMITTVADTTATIDCEAYTSDREGLKTGSDLVSTAATTINSLVLADKDFVLDAASLVPGDIVDVRVAIAVNDAATGTAVLARIGAIELVCDVKG